MLLPLPQSPRSCLLVVDMQGFFFQQPGRRRRLPQVTKNINRLIDAFDRRTFPVFHIISCYKPDGSDWDLKMKASGESELIENTTEAAILPEITVTGNHRTLVKTRYSAFFKTNLAELLHAQNIHQTVVVGAFTHYCINATIFDAYGHDFVPCIVTDAVISHLPAESEMIIDRMRRNGYHVVPTQSLIDEIKGS